MATLPNTYSQTSHRRFGMLVLGLHVEGQKYVKYLRFAKVKMVLDGGKIHFWVFVSRNNFYFLGYFSKPYASQYLCQVSRIHRLIPPRPQDEKMKQQLLKYTACPEVIFLVLCRISQWLIGGLGPGGLDILGPFIGYLPLVDRNAVEFSRQSGDFYCESVFGYFWLLFGVLFLGGKPETRI